jgi:hypothetical protein
MDNELLRWYFWISMAGTFLLALYVPPHLSRVNNLTGSIGVAIMGPIVWPFVLVAAVIHHRRNK